MPVTFAWTPRTQEQSESVERLARESGGALVKIRSDGAAEVLATPGGRYTRYLVDEDGSTVVVASQPRDWRSPLEKFLGWGFVVFAFAVPLVMVALHRLGIVGGSYEFVAFISVMAGLVLLVGAFAVGPSPYSLIPPGDASSEWSRVAWPDH